MASYIHYNAVPPSHAWGLFFSTTTHASHVYKAEVAWTIKGIPKRSNSCFKAHSLHVADSQRFEMAPRTQFLPAFFATFLVIVLPCKCMCKSESVIRAAYCCISLFNLGNDCVAVPTIISSSDVCRVVSHGSLSYTCKNDDSSLLWKCISVFTKPIIVIGESTTHIPELSVAGLTLTENNTYNEDLDCINSTLTFAGSLEILQTLNGLVINCTDKVNTDNATIVIPSEYTVATMIFLIQK